MIECCLKNRELNDYVVILPHEINNEFFRKIRWSIQTWEINLINYFPILNDFWTVEFSVEELDKLYKDFEILEENLDEIIKIVPLPKMVWTFDWMLYVWYRTNVWFDNYVELWTGWWKYFNKEDILYLLSLIKKKILEAKEKNETLIFSGD